SLPDARRADEEQEWTLCHGGRRRLPRIGDCPITVRCDQLRCRVVFCSLDLRNRKLALFRHLLGERLRATRTNCETLQDSVLHLEQADLALDVHQHATKSFLDAERCEQTLLFGFCFQHKTAYEIRETAGVRYRVQYLVNDFLWKTAPFAELRRSFAQLFVKRD